MQTESDELQFCFTMYHTMVCHSLIRWHNFCLHLPLYVFM